MVKPYLPLRFLKTLFHLPPAAGYLHQFLYRSTLPAEADERT
jgi:hypothetical protein